MGKSLMSILEQEAFTKEDLVIMLRSGGTEKALLFQKSAEIKEKYIGKKVWFRGLIEFSNICGKDCQVCLRNILQISL